MHLEVSSRVENLAVVQRALDELLCGHGVGEAARDRLGPKVSDILHITQLISVFETYDNEQAALDSF